MARAGENDNEGRRWKDGYRTEEGGESCREIEGAVYSLLMRLRAMTTETRDGLAEGEECGCCGGVSALEDGREKLACSVVQYLVLLSMHPRAQPAAPPAWENGRDTPPKRALTRGAQSRASAPLLAYRESRDGLERVCSVDWTSTRSEQALKLTGKRERCGGSDRVGAGAPFKGRRTPRPNRPSRRR